MDKVYDGEPVAFDPYDGKTFVIDGGKTGWGVLEKNGEARFLWRKYMEKGKEGFWQNMEEGAVPTDPGRYQLVIQEMDGKDWQDAAIFEFEITGGGGPISFTVSFDALGGVPGPETQTVSAGGTVTAPADPLKIGSVFTGWYTDEACGAETRYSFDTPVTENMTLYAGWMNPETAGILKLPAGLTAIEDEAFAGASAEAVVIPNSVTVISGDPFAGSQVRYIYGYAGSEAQAFTENHPAYTFVPIDDAWQASHFEEG